MSCHVNVMTDLDAEQKQLLCVPKIISFELKVPFLVTILSETYQYVRLLVKCTVNVIYVLPASQETRIRQRSGNDFFHFAVHVCQKQTQASPDYQFNSRFWRKKLDSPEQDLNPRPLDHEANTLPLIHEGQLRPLAKFSLELKKIQQILKPFNKFLKCNREGLLDSFSYCYW